MIHANKKRWRSKIVEFGFDLKLTIERENDVNIVCPKNPEGLRFTEKLHGKNT